MENKVLSNYFPAVKFICMAAISVYIVFMRQTDDWLMSWQVCLLALVLLLGVLHEYGGERRWIFLLLEGFLLIIGSRFIRPNILLLLPFFVMDAVAFLKLKWYFFLIPSLGFSWLESEQVVYLLVCLFSAMLYLQHYVFMVHYRKRMEWYEQQEYALKDTIDTNETRVKAQLWENGLLYEKKMLEERARLSQALHDKLGHSINGSIYQLEACKALLKAEEGNRKEECTGGISPEGSRSRLILQNVIDSLRVSMDEIRNILRKEKPDRKQTALIQLYGLKDECRDKYGIDMELKLKGDTGKISSRQWEVILDNTFEAVTNALKYAGCSRIEVTVLILNKVIRCCIRDNGEGCKKLETGMGIEGMKKRVRQIKGTLDIHMEEGFSVNMLFPLEEDGKLN